MMNAVYTILKGSNFYIEMYVYFLLEVESNKAHLELIYFCVY
jgi:hypothetical protein